MDSAGTVQGSGHSSKPSEPSSPKEPLGQRAKNFWHRWYLACCCLIIAILPLLTTAGRNLEYEYTTMVGWLAWLVLPIAGFFAPQAVLFRYLDRPKLSAKRLLWIFFGAPALVCFIPYLLFTIGACPCSKTGFTFWTFIQSFPALILGHACYYGGLRLRCQGANRFSLTFRYGLVLFIVALLVALELWFNPQKRMTNLFTGFIHGPIYDDFIAMDRGIILARQSHVIIAAALVLASLMSITRRNIIIVACLMLTAFGFSLLSGTYPSTRHGTEALQEYLRGTLEGDGIVLHYKPEANVSEDGTPKEGPPSQPSNSVKWVFQDAQFHFRELREILGRPPKEIHIYLYPDAEAKKLHFGGGSTDVTDVVTPSIHITMTGWPHPTLRHELVHAMTAHLGYKGLGFHPNMAFTEGLAVALAPGESSLSLDEGVANLIHANKLPKMESLFTPLFWKESSSIAYTVAGSFLQFLTTTYGIEGVKKLYSGATWKKAFKVSSAEVVEKWQQKISFGVDQARLDLAAEQFFRDPGILQDRCPHSKADLRRDRTDGFFVRMRQPVGWEPDQDYWNWRLKMAPTDREAQLQSLKIVVNSLAAARVLNRPALADHLIQATQQKIWPPKSIEDVEFALVESDLHRLLDAPEKSSAILADVVKVAASGRLSEGLVRSIYARLRVEQNIVGPRAVSWRKFIAGWRTEPPERGESEPWILTYLRVRRGDKALTAPSNLGSLMTMGIDQELPQTFRTEWYKILADQFMRNGDYPAAKTAYEYASRNASPGRIAFLEEQGRRALFYADYKAPGKLGDTRR